MMFEGYGQPRRSGTGEHAPNPDGLNRLARALATPAARPLAHTWAAIARSGESCSDSGPHEPTWAPSSGLRRDVPDASAPGGGTGPKLDPTLPLSLLQNLACSDDRKPQ